MQRLGHGVRLGEKGHVVIGRHWIVECGVRIEREAQADADPIPDKPGGCRDPFRRQVVKRSPLVPLAPAPPGAEGIEQGAEFVCTHQ
jgi:hypothetical protein